MDDAGTLVFVHSCNYLQRIPMPEHQSAILKSKYLNNWGFFSVVAVPMSIAVLLKTVTVDLSSGPGVSAMITFSVRLAVPWLFFAFAASSMFVVFPGTFSQWMLRNQRILGLCFAAGMAWQLFFIFWLVIFQHAYYMENVFAFHSLIEQIPGYLVLTAMVITSFQPGRSKLSARQWKLLHKVGIYFLWGVLFSAYWYELFYYDDIQVIDYVYFWLGFAAWGVRMLAWSKKRAQRPVSS